MGTKELKAEIIKSLDGLSDENLSKILWQTIDLQESFKDEESWRKHVELILVEDAELLKRLAD